MNYIELIINALVIFILCAAITKLLSAFLRRALLKSSLDKTLSGFLSQAAKIAMWVITFLITAQRLGIPSSSLVTLLGAVGLALSLAVQGIVANLLSGATMLISKPFLAGDSVEISGITGTVETVGMFHTRVITQDNRRVYLPNKDVASSKIINFAQNSTRRVDIEFSAAHNSDNSAVKSAVIALMKSDARVLPEPEPFAALMSIEPTHLRYVLRAWTSTEDYWDVYYSLTEAIIPALKEAGADAAYPLIAYGICSSDKIS